MAGQHVWELLSLCHSLGIVINDEKSDLVPSQSATYLGMTIDTVAAKVFPTLAQVEKFLSVAEQFFTVTTPPCSALAGAVGAPVFAGEASTSRTSSIALSPVAFEDPLVPRVGSSQSPGTLVSGSGGGPLLVDGEGSPSHGGTFRDACSGPSPVFGRFSVGVGRTPLRSVGVWGVASAGEFSAHQSPGEESFIPGSSVHPGDGHGSPCDRDVRQLDGGCLHQQARRDGVRLPLLVDQATSPMSRVLRCPVEGELSVRGGPMFWQISSAVGSRLSGPSGLSIPRWREHSFVFGVLRRWTCSRHTSTRSFPCTAPSSRIPRPSSRMRSDIRGTGWTCTLFLPFPWSGGLWLESERPQISP